MARVLAVWCAAGLLAATVVEATAAQGGDGLDRDVLEARCAENASTGDDLAACLDVVRRILAPAPEAASTATETPSDQVEMSGAGAGSSEAFTLAGSDYLATLVASDDDGDGYPCYVSAVLRSTEDGSDTGRLRGQAAEGESSEIASYLYSVPQGRYYWDTELTSCAWDLSLDSVALDHVEAADGPVSVTGVDTLNAPPIVLTGGGYVADYEVTASEKGDCDFDAYLIPTAQPAQWASVGEVSADAPRGETVRGQSRFYAVEPGEYSWSTSVLVFSAEYAPCEWTLTVAPE